MIVILAAPDPSSFVQGLEITFSDPHNNEMFTQAVQTELDAGHVPDVIAAQVRDIFKQNLCEIYSSISQQDVATSNSNYLIVWDPEGNLNAVAATGEMSWSTQVLEDLRREDSAGLPDLSKESSIEDPFAAGSPDNSL